VLSFSSTSGLPLQMPIPSASLLVQSVERPLDCEVRVREGEDVIQLGEPFLRNYAVVFDGRPDSLGHSRVGFSLSSTNTFHHHKTNTDGNDHFWAWAAGVGFVLVFLAFLVFLGVLWGRGKRHSDADANKIYKQVSAIQAEEDHSQ